jgi:hypothetical protein
VNIGVAAHITAASPGGPRYDDSITPEQRSSITNALWLCQNCAALIDRDTGRFTAAKLREWKERAEQAQKLQLTAGSEFREIASSEVVRGLSTGERAVLMALEEEFGCHVEINVDVAAGGGRLNLHGAVVRGEELVAVDIHEYMGGGFPYFQIEYLIGMGSTLKFDRFKGFVLYVAVVSNVDESLDEAVRQRLEQIAEGASCEVRVRMYRLNKLRAKHNL